MFDTLSEKFSNAFKHLSGKGKISESNIEETLSEVRTALLEADVNFKVVKDFIANVKAKAIGEKVISGVNPGEQFIKIVHDQLCSVMGEANEEINLDRPPVVPIIIVGLNGQGKTTFSAKLACHLKNKKNKTVMLAPADTFRPAAKDQLQTLAKNNSLTCLDTDLKKSPRDIALWAMEEAKKNHQEVLIIDTAGRLHVDDELMNELVQLKNALGPFNPEVLLVADAMTGQEAVNVAKVFQEKIGLTGIVLTKMDSDARGGAALSIRHATGVPIRYVSNGEKMKDFELFHPDRLAKRILDMGDVLTLVEKAQENINESEAQDMMKNLEKGKFTVEDFLKQMEMMASLGPMTGLLKMIPGMGGALREMGDLSPAENEMKRMKVIISSMTKKERQNYKIMKESHIERVARGSGTTGSQVKDFIAKFKQMEQMMGGMMAMMKGGIPSMPGMGHGAKAGFRSTGEDNPFGQKGKKKPGGGNPWGKYF